MSTVAKNKILTWLVVLLLVANAATITMFWLNKGKRPPQPKGTPQEFLISELQLDTKQQEQLSVLVKEHRQAAELLRKKTREAKEALFDLVKQNSVSDSTKLAAAKAVSVNTEALDLLTLNHFQKVRAICSAAQQEKFDGIIHEVTAMLGQPRPPMRPGGPGNDPQGPPPGGPGDNRPPPPPGE